MTQLAARTWRSSRGRWHLIADDPNRANPASACGRYFLAKYDSTPPNPHIDAELIHPDERCTHCKGWPNYGRGEA